MSLTRKMLKGMNLTEEQVESIIEEHSAVVNALKDERDAYKEDAEKLKETEKALEEATKKLESDTSKADLEKLQKEYDDFKSSVNEKETKQKKTELRKKILKDAGIPDNWIDRASKSISLDDIKLDKEGNAEDSDKIIDKIKEEWSDVIGKVETKGANVSKPPANTGKGTITKEDIMKIKDTNERQQAILDNRELFGI